MQIKISLLLILISGVGNALSVAFPVHGLENNNVPDIANTITPHPIEYGLVSSTHDKKLSSEVHFNLSAIKRTIPGKIQSSQLFQSKSWYKAPVAPSPTTIQSIALPPPPPSAPPLPFSFIGRMIDGKSATLFLSRNDQHFIVKVNDIIEDTYQVVAISDNDAELIYLPMKVTQKLAFDSNLAANPNLDSQSISSKFGVNPLPLNAAQTMAAPAKLAQAVAAPSSTPQSAATTVNAEQSVASPANTAQSAAAPVNMPVSNR